LLFFCNQIEGTFDSVLISAKGKPKELLEAMSNFLSKKADWKSVIL
jgi:hypothetical protein